MNSAVSRLMPTIHQKEIQQMEAHHSSFGDAIGSPDYHLFSVIFRDEDGAHIGNLNPARQPYPRYAVGDFLEVRGTLRPIIQILHSVIPNDPPKDWVLQATVVIR